MDCKALFKSLKVLDSASGLTAATFAAEDVELPRAVFNGSKDTIAFGTFVVPPLLVLSIGTVCDCDDKNLPRFSAKCLRRKTVVK